ncbi:ensconsin isoform X3 [Conger conger]|uniref:ensconsin isoform X3 n=1 Tax=Conger conger TaxID=82655 RepID=UPI002A5A8824|nr:ensconsin isoform X3 [Conger conger]
MADRERADVSPIASEGGDGGSSQPRSEEKKPSCRSPCSGTGQNNSNNSTGSKPEPLVLKIDERQRLARERREEQEKQIAVRESAWQERAERAKQYYEKHLEERRQKLEEQRLREERRRTAVEEKRRQRLEEDKVRHEAVMRRTLERSQRANQKPNRWSWGGALQGSTAHPSDADRRSVSTANLSKHAEPIITKRLSSSSATLLNSPDRALQRWTSSLKKSQSRPRVCKDHSPRDVPSASRRLPLTPWESSVVNRLLTPTHSYLARSKSAASLSGEAVIPVCPRSASCHPGTSTSFRTLQCRNGERPRAALSSLDSVHRRRSANPPTGNKRDKDYVRKSWSNLSVAPPVDVKRSWCPGNQKSRATLPSPVRANHKAAPRPPTPKRVRSPPPPQAPPTREEPSSPGRPLSPGNVRPVRAEPQGEELATPGKSNRKAETPAPSRDPPSDSSPPSVATPPGAGRLSAGTTDPEEATRLLAEKRRQAREQREREEEERRLREETERRGREEMARRKAEERARREEEAQHLAEERRKREEEEKLAEEERLQREREEAERLQRQKEEEEARQREEDERLRLEREKHFQKEEAERLERKKRLEEIMKRTRRSEPAEKKSVPHRNGEFSEPKAEVTAPPPQPTPPSVTVTEEDQDLEDQDLEDQDQDLEHVDRNGHRYAGGYAPALPTIAESTSSPEARPRENGVPEPGLDEAFEEVISLPVGARLVRLEDDDLIPVVAFRENGSLRPLASVEDVQARQRAEPP